MEAALSGLLKKHEVHEDIVLNLLALGCTSVDLFANWADDAADAVKACIDGTSQADVLPQKARVRLAWKTAKALIDKKLKRVAEGIEDIDPEEPLDTGTQGSLEVSFQRASGWPALPADRVGSDAIVARFHREFIRRRPTVFQLSMLVTAADSSKALPAKRQKLAANVDIVISGAEADKVPLPIGSLLQILNSLEVVANTWAVAGAYDTIVDTKTVKFAPWPDCLAYSGDVRKRAMKLLDTFTEASVVPYVIDREEAWRLEAIELMRASEDTTWGMAITTIRKDNVSTWQEDHYKLIKYGQPGGSSGGLASLKPREGPTGGKAKGKGDKGKGKGSKGDKSEGISVTSRKKWKTSNKDSSNRWICRKYNDTRGCSSPCPDGSVHCCDVVLTNGKVCMTTSHNRLGHNPKTHGEPGIFRK